MTNIAVTIRDGVATAKLTGILTTGMVGVPVTFDLGPEWENLTIIAVIRGNGLIFDRPLLGTRQTTVPYEVLEKVGEHIYIGAEGCSASGDLVIQSNFAKVEETVRQGADPSGDIAIDPTQPIWAELMHEVEDLRENTVDPETLSQHDLDPLAHAPIREQLQSLEAGKLSISDIADDLYSKSSTMALSANMGAYLREKTETDLLTVQKDLEAQVKERVKTVNGIAPDASGNVVVAGGSDGSGEDGYSPVANVTQTDTGAVISITDKSGTTTATVTNGADGRTPVKGVDYFTATEVKEIAEIAAELVDVPEGDGSGGSCDALQMTITLEEAVNTVTVTLPCTLDKLLIANIHFKLPNLSSALKLYAIFGSQTKGFTEVSAATGGSASGADIYILKHYDDMFMCSYAAAANYANNARVGTINQTISYSVSNEIRFYSNTSGVDFPAGTQLTIWGVYTK